MFVLPTQFHIFLDGISIFDYHVNLLQIFAFMSLEILMFDSTHFQPTHYYSRLCKKRLVIVIFWQSADAKKLKRENFQLSFWNLFIHWEKYMVKKNRLLESVSALG